MAAEFDEFVLVDDYIPEEEDRKQHLLARAGEVVKVLQQKESGTCHTIPLLLCVVLTCVTEV